MSPYPKVIVQTFENYAKSQLTFVHSIAEMASKSLYAECLRESHVVDIIMPLSINMNPTVRMNVILALGRLAGHSELCSKQMLCSKNLLYQMLYEQIGQENKYYRKNCMNLVRNLSKHSPTNSEITIKECGGMEAILICLKDFDLFVREAALQTISTIARQDASLSLFIVNSGILPAIVLCLKEQQQNLKLYALTALDDIAKHNEDLAQSVVEAASLPPVISFLSGNSTDIKVLKNSLILIKNIVKHSLYLTESAIESNLFPEILLLMAHPDESIRNNAAKVVRETVKHSVQIAQMVVNSGGIASLLNVISCSNEFSCIPAILSLGYIAGMSPIFASAIIHSEVLLQLTAILKNDTDQHTKAGTVWTLGMIGHHSSEHSKSICACGAVAAMIDVYTDPNLDNDSRHKCRVALQQILYQCDEYTNLEELLDPLPPIEIISYILDKISKILPKSSKSRREFITNGHLKMIQNIRPEIDSDLHKIIKSVNCCFPEDVIQMVAGDFPETVMKTVDKYVPKSQCLYYNRQARSEEKITKPHGPENKTFVEESSFE